MECNTTGVQIPTIVSEKDVFGQNSRIPRGDNKINVRSLKAELPNHSSEVINNFTGDSSPHSSLGNSDSVGLLSEVMSSRVDNDGSAMDKTVSLVDSSSESLDSNENRKVLLSVGSSVGKSDEETLDEDSDEMEEDSLDSTLSHGVGEDFKTWLIPRKEVIKPKDPIESPAPPQRKRSKPLKFKLITTEEDEVAKANQQTGDLCEDPFQKTHFVKYLKQKDKPKRIWECGICAREFSHQFELTRHLPVHAMSNTYSCSICGKGFKQLSTLSQHKAMHSRAKPYVCEICLKCFARVSSLISHKKIHSVHKQFQCEVCGKGFTQKANMQKHMQTHDQNKPYRCEVCNRGFYQIANLLCHRVKAHTLDAGRIGGIPIMVNSEEETSSSCPLCLKKFNSHGSLKHHIESVHFTWLHTKKRSKLVNNARIVQLPSGEKIAIRFPDSNSKIKYEGENSRPSSLGLLVPSEATPLHKIKITKVLSAEETEALRERERVHREQMYPKSLSYSSLKDSSGAGSTRVKSILPQSQGMMIDPIQTKAMEAARQGGNIPFALFKSARGVQVLVKVVEGLGDKQVLVPATGDDLRNTGRVTFPCDGKDLPGRALQIRVPVVAIVTQRIEDDGQVTLSVEPPPSEVDDIPPEQPPAPPEQCDDTMAESSIEFLTQHYGDLTSPLLGARGGTDIPLELLKNLSQVGSEEDGEGASGLDPPGLEMTQLIQFVKEDGSILTEQEIQALSPGLSALDFLSAAVNFPTHQSEGDGEEETMEVPENLSSGSSVMEQLAIQGVQFLKHRSDGTYEILDQEEATKLMGEPGQTIEIVQQPSSSQGDKRQQVIISNMLPSDVLESHMEEDDPNSEASHSLVIGQYHQISHPEDPHDKYQMIIPNESVKFILAGEELHST